MRQAWYGTPRLDVHIMCQLCSEFTPSQKNPRRMNKPADQVVYDFGLREGLMTAFMANDPKASCEEASPETVE